MIKLNLTGVVVWNANACYHCIHSKFDNLLWLVLIFFLSITTSRFELNICQGWGQVFLTMPTVLQ